MRPYLLMHALDEVGVPAGKRAHRQDANAEFTLVVGAQVKIVSNVCKQFITRSKV